jgi:hypothetical protein
MQNYAAYDAENKGLVKQVVLYGAPLTKKTDQIGGADSVLIVDIGDQTWTNATAPHVDAYNSYDASDSDQWAVYVAGSPSSSDTHGQATYRRDAVEFDTRMTGKNPPSDLAKIYKNMQKFDGNIQQVRSIRTT